MAHVDARVRGEAMKRSAVAALISLLALSAPALISAEGEDKQPPRDLPRAVDRPRPHAGA